MNDKIIVGSMVAAGEIDLMPDRGRKPDTVSCAVLVQFDTPEELKRAISGEPVTMRWAFDRKSLSEQQCFI